MKTFFLLTLLLCSQAFAGEWETLLGVSRFTKQNDGVWYQEAFPYKIDLTAPSVGFRYTEDADRDGLGWTAGYVHLGRVTSHAKAVALDGRNPDDGGYNAATKGCNGKCWPLSTWNGTGDVQGFYLGAVKQLNPDWAVEGGVYLYRPTWVMDIPDWIPERDAAPRHLRVEHHAFWQPGPYVGLRWKPQGQPLSLNFSVWQTATREDQWCSIYHNATYNLSVGYAW